MAQQQDNFRDVWVGMEIPEVGFGADFGDAMMKYANDESMSPSSTAKYDFKHTNDESILKVTQGITEDGLSLLILTVKTSKLNNDCKTREPSLTIDCEITRELSHLSAIFEYASSHQL